MPECCLGIPIREKSGSFGATMKGGYVLPFPEIQKIANAFKK